MSTVQPTDKVLVQRATTLHSAPADMSTVQDTDLLLINRAGVDYKCTFADWKNSQSKPPAIASVTLADSPEAGRFTSGTFRSTVVMTDEGIPASAKGIKAYVEGTLKSHPQTSGIASVAGSVLTLTDATDISRFATGDAVTEVTAAGVAGDATGTVGSVDATAKTITLSATSGTWDVGSQVKGPLKTQQVTVTPNSDEIVVVNTSGAQPVLTFKTDKDLAKFASGDAVKQDNYAWSGRAHVPVGYRTSTAKNTGWNGGTAATVPSPPIKPDYIFWADLGASVIVKSLSFRVSGIANAASSSQLHNFILFYGDNPGAVGSSLCGVGCTINKVPTVTGTPPGDVVVTFNNIPATPARYWGITNGAGSSTSFQAMVFSDLAFSEDGTPPVMTGASGTVGSVNTTAKTMTLATSTGTWGPVNAGHYVIGPTKTGPAANVKLFCKLNAGLTVTDLQSADPGYTTVTGAGPYTVTFPATLPSGNPPDTDLPAGTHLVTEVQASNSSATVHKASNTVTPA
jgi:hypothetical protein